MGVNNFDEAAFYPYIFTRMSVTKTTENSTSITSGALVTGHIYSILEAPSGGTPAFDGASDLTKGATFIATGTGATWGIKWLYIYNDDDFCVSYSVVDDLNRVIKP